MVIWDTMELIMTSPKWQPNSLRTFFTLFYNKKNHHIDLEIPLISVFLGVSLTTGSPHWFRQWLGTVMQQDINWTSDDQGNVICCWHYTAKSYTHIMRNKNPICMHTKNIFQENAHGPRIHHCLQDWGKLSTTCYSMCFSLPLTHWGLDKIEDILQMTFLNWFIWMKTFSSKLSTKCYSMCFSLPLTHRGLNKIEDILQMTFSTGFLNENILISNKISWKYVP